MVSNEPCSTSSAANIRVHWSSKRRASIPSRTGSNGDMASSPKMMPVAGGAVFSNTTRYVSTQTPRPDCVVPADRPLSFHTRGYVRRRSKPGSGARPLDERHQSEMDDERAAAMLKALVYEGPATALGRGDSVGFSYGAGGGGGVSKEGSRGQEGDGNEEEDAAMAAAIAAALAWSPTQAMPGRTWEEHSQGSESDEWDESDEDEERSRSDSGTSVSSRAEELTAHDEARRHAGDDGENVVTADENFATFNGHVINNASPVVAPDETVENSQEVRRRPDENGFTLTCTSACGSNSSTDGGKACKGEDGPEQERVMALLTSSPSPVDSSASAGTGWVEKYSMGTTTSAGVRSVAAKQLDASGARVFPANCDKRDSSRQEKQRELGTAGGGDSQDDILQAIGAAAAARHLCETGIRSASRRYVAPGTPERHQDVTSTQESRGSSEEKRAVSVAAAASASRLEVLESGVGMGVVGIPRRSRPGPGRSVGSVEQKELGGYRESGHRIQRPLISETGLLAIEDDDDDDDDNDNDVEGTASGGREGWSSFNNSSDGNDVTSSDLSHASGNHRHRGAADGNNCWIAGDDRSVVMRVGAIRSSDRIGASDVEEGGAMPNMAAIPYRRLNGVGRHWPPGVNPARREEWLSPGEFSTVFAMSYSAFRRLPSWKRIILKQEVDLF